jgi:hypothetical protein
MSSPPCPVAGNNDWLKTHGSAAVWHALTQWWPCCTATQAASDEARIYISASENFAKNDPSKTSAAQMRRDKREFTAPRGPAPRCRLIAVVTGNRVCNGAPGASTAEFLKTQFSRISPCDYCRIGDARGEYFRVLTYSIWYGQAVATLNPLIVCNASALALLCACSAASWTSFSARQNSSARQATGRH